MSLETSISNLKEAKGSFTNITLDNKTLEGMLVYIGQENKKWIAKVRLNLRDKYITRTGQSNSHSEEAIKRALLNAYDVTKEI